MKTKYIIISKDDMEVPVVIPELLLHSESAGKRKPASAGFCEVAEDGKWRVYGWSTSLQLNSRPQDAAILNAQLL